MGKKKKKSIPEKAWRHRSGAGQRVIILGQVFDRVHLSKGDCGCFLKPQPDDLESEDFAAKLEKVLHAHPNYSLVQTGQLERAKKADPLDLADLKAKLNTLTVAQLVKRFAEPYGIEVPRGMRKAQLIEAIEAKARGIKDARASSAGEADEAESADNDTPGAAEEAKTDA